ncbi:MAG: hypothetical protein AAGH68_04495 [Pseudomonadota bacterium]
MWIGTKTLAGILAIGLAFSTALPAAAGLQKWSLIHMDDNRQPSSVAKATLVETSAWTQRGFTVSIGCYSGGGHMIALQAPDDLAKDFAGPEIQPSLRLSKPGTDFFRGPVGKLSFDGTRYTGPLPEPIVGPMKDKIRDGLLAITEPLTRTIISLKTAGVERALAEMNCP